MRTGAHQEGCGPPPGPAASSPCSGGRPPRCPGTDEQQARFTRRGQASLPLRDAGPFHPQAGGWPGQGTVEPTRGQVLSPGGVPGSLSGYGHPVRRWQRLLAGLSGDGLGTRASSLLQPAHLPRLAGQAYCRRGCTVRYVLTPHGALPSLRSRGSKPDQVNQR